MKLMFYALALYVGYRIAVENRRDAAPTGLLEPPQSDKAPAAPKAGAV